MQFAKWVHVKIQGWKGLATVVVPNFLTVEDFKQVLDLEARCAVTVPAHFLPLAEEANLYDLVNEFDTVRVER